MANDGKIYITISDKRFGKNKAEADEQQNQQDKKKDKKNNPLADYAKHQFFSLVKQQAVQAANYAISNIGNFTGNYVSQMHVEDSKRVLDAFVGYGMSFIAGTQMTGSPIGGAVAVGISVVGQTIGTIEQLYAGYVDNARTNRAIAQLRTRAGLNITNNGSRGTEY